MGGKENYIVYNLVCIFIIIIIIIISSSNISISFVALLNCLYLNPHILPFVRFPSLSCWGGRGGVSKWLSSAELPADRLNHNSDMAVGECAHEDVVTKGLSK